MAETKFISRIKVPTGDVYEIKDVELSNVYKKTETSSAADISSAFWRKITVDNRISGTISHPDLSVIKLDAAEYANLLSCNRILSDAVYIVEDDHMDAYGQRLKNLASPADLSDATTKEYVDSAIALSAGNKIYIDDRISSTSGYSDLSIIRLSASEYESLPQEQRQLSNALYVVEDDSGDNHGKQIKNLAPGTDLSDAVNLEQLSNAISGISIPTDLGAFTNSPGYLVSNDISDYYKKSETSSAVEISSALEQKSSVQIVVKESDVSSTLSALVINNVTQQEYLALSAAGQTVSSELYIIDPDSANLDARGDWVTNVKTPELSSDAANKAYVDSQLSNAGGGFSFERYWPAYNSAAQTYVLKPGKFNILSAKINPGDNLVLEDYTQDNVYKVQLTGNNETSAMLNVLVDANAGDMLPGAYRDDTIASCLTVVAPKQVYNFEVSYGNLILNGDYNGDALRTLYPFPAGGHVYGEEGYEAYGVMPLDNACNHLSVGPGGEYDGKTFHVVIPGRVRTNKVRRMRRFSIMLRDEFAERGMQFQFPSRDVNNGQVQYTFVCGSQYAQNPKQGDIVIFDEYQKDRFYIDVKNVDQNVWYQFTTPTPSEGVVTMKDRCVNYVNIKATASVTWEWSDGGSHAPPYYDESYDPPKWTNNGDQYEIINYDSGPNAKIIYAYPDPNDHDESTIIVAQKVTSYVTQNGVVQMPPQNPGKCRDFLLRLRVDQDPPPNITFSGGNFESESGNFPEIETGVQVLSFTETKTNTFMVSSKVLTKIT